jgi:AAA ATPase-like protein
MFSALARPVPSLIGSYPYSSPSQNIPETRRNSTPRLRDTTPSVTELPSSLAADPAQSARSAEKGLLRKEGEYWTVGYGGKVFRLKDTKGLAYLAQLLRSPGTDVHALDLVGGTVDRGEWREDEADRCVALPQRVEELARAGIHIGSLGDAGEVLDEPAKAAYRRRLADLRIEVEEAKQLDQFERAEQAEEEIEALLAELARGVGLGGRHRRAVSAAERARQSVSRALKTVVQRIAEYNPALGALFSRCIKTGTFCTYNPDPSSPIAWEFGVTRHNLAGAPAEQTPSGSPSARRPADEGSTVDEEFLASQLSSAHRTPFVGREAECERLRALVGHALTGQGSLVMLGGEPGVGKTRLALEMAQEAARQGFRVLSGRCYEREKPYPYLPFAEMIETVLAQAPSPEEFRQWLGANAAEFALIAPRLRRILPDTLASVELPPPQARRDLFQSLTECLARASRQIPLFLILDDLQWAEESTLALLHYLANRVGQLPIVIVATYRDSALDTNPALVRTLEELLRIGLRPLKLHGLSHDAVAQMLQGLSHREPPQHLVRVIFAETQGNPFFVQEVYKHLVEEGKIFDDTGQFRADLTVDEVDVPDNVRLVLGRRLGQLSETARQVLGAAAVIGRHFSFPLLETLLEQVDSENLLTALEEAQRMGLIVSSAEGSAASFTFAHELVRQTLLADLALPRRQRLHLTVAAALERVHDSAVHECAGEIAHHLVQAGSLAETQRVVHYLTLAGSGALAAVAYDEALRHFAAALSYRDALDARQQAQLMKHLSRAKRGLGRQDEAVDH